MLLLGFSSGLPVALTSSTLQAWYAVDGASLVVIGFLNLVGQPYVYKFLWAPVLDRYIPPFLGRRRGWVLITQLLLVIAIALMAGFTPSAHPYALASLALAVAFLSASQDISLDAYRTDILEPEERALGSAVWISGYRIAMLVSGGVALLLAQYFGWQVTMLVMSACMFVGIVTIFFAETPNNDRDVPASMATAIVGPFKEFFSRRCALLILLFIVLFKLPDAFALSLNTAFYLRGVGFSLLQLGTALKSMTLLGTLIGLFLGGIIMLRLKMYRSLMLFGFLQAVTNFCYIWLFVAGQSYWLLVVTILIENITAGMGTAALLAFLMALCDKRYTAMQISLLTAFMAVGRIFVGPVAGVVVTHIGWIQFFLWSFIIAIPGLALLWYLNRHVDIDGVKVE